MIGKTYLERGQPVVVVKRWASTCALPAPSYIVAPDPKQGPRNVLIRRGDGTLVVRPFRGLRLPQSVTPRR